jgi:hypothetical protein
MLAHLRMHMVICFSRSETPIFHCAGGEETETKVLFSVAPDASLSYIGRWCQRQVPIELAALCSAVHQRVRGFRTGRWSCTVHESGEVVTSVASRSFACTGRWSVR